MGQNYGLTIFIVVLTLQLVIEPLMHLREKLRKRLKQITYNICIILVPSTIYIILGTINRNLIKNGVIQGIFGGIVMFFIMYPIQKKK